MAVNLRDILTGIAVRRAHEYRHRFIDDFFPVHDMTKRQHAVHERFPIFRAEHPCEDLFASASADAYNGDAAFARRRRLRGDGIQMMIHAQSLRLFTKSSVTRLYHGTARLKSAQTVRLPSANLPKSTECMNFFLTSLDFV